MNTAPADPRSAPHLRQRILSAFPAGHYALDTFFRLADVVESTAFPTAAIECVTTPRLHLNPGFVATHCRTDEHLFMLVMHELHHVLLGHTRLFRRVTAVDNIALDAVINAILSHLFPHPAYTSFFTELYAADTLPGALLRPPDGWPATPRFPGTLPAHIREVITTLYSESGGTYKEVYDLLQQDAALIRALAEARIDGDGNGSGVGAPLLGDHSPEDTPGHGESAANHPVLVGVVRHIVEQWPMPPNPIRGRSVGGDLRDILIRGVAVPRRADQILRTMLRKMVEPDRRGAAATGRRIDVDHRAIEAPLPTLRDRRAFAAAAAGWAPLVWRTVIPMRRMTVDAGSSAVYVDVSGSTTPYHALLASLIRPYVERKQAKLFAFSEYVVDVTPTNLAHGEFRSSGGTDGTCIWKHALDAGLRKIVVLTDGYVGAVSRYWRNRIAAESLHIRVALTPDGFLDDLQPIAEEIVDLPTHM